MTITHTARTFWQQINPRERLVISGGALLLLIIIVYFYLWQPLSQERLRLRASLPQLKLSAAQMRANVDEVMRLKANLNQAPQSAQSLHTMLEQSAAAYKLRESMSQLNTEGDNRIRLSMASVPFDDWIQWLAQLQTQYRIRLESCRVEGLAQPGMVKVEAVLIGAGKG